MNVCKLFGQCTSIKKTYYLGNVLTQLQVSHEPNSLIKSKTNSIEEIFFVSINVNVMIIT